MAIKEKIKTEWTCPDVADEVQIRRGQNGYMAYEGPISPNVAMPLPYVFESYESLEKWLAGRLEERMDDNPDQTKTGERR